MNTQKKFHYAWLIFLGCCCFNAGGLALTSSILGIYMGPMSEKLGCTTADFALFAGIAGGVSALIMPTWGRLLQTKNIRVTTSAASLFLIIGLVGLAFVTEVWHTWIIGAFMGLGWAPVLLMISPTLMGNWFSPSRRGRYLGVAAAFTGLGTFVWAPMFALIIQNFGVQTSYLINAGLMTVLLLPWALFVFKFRPEDAGLKPLGFEKDVDSTKASANLDKGMSAPHAIKTVPFWLIICSLGLCALGTGFISNGPGVAKEFLGTSGMDQTAIALLGASMISAAAIGNLVGKATMGFLIDKIGIQVTFILFYVIFFVSFLLWLLAPNNVGLLVGSFLLGTHACFVSVGYPLLVRVVFGNRDYAKIYGRAGMINIALGSFSASLLAYVYQAAQTYLAVIFTGIGVVVVITIAALVVFALMKKIRWDSEDSESPAEAPPVS
jgi:MFS family permease